MAKSNQGRDRMSFSALPYDIDHKLSFVFVLIEQIVTCILKFLARIILSPKMTLSSVYDVMINIHDAYTGRTAPLLMYINQQNEVAATKQLREHPEDLRRTDQCRYTALHLACIHEASEDFLCELIDTHPEGVLEENVYGEIPLHKLASIYNRTTSIRVVQKMMHVSKGRVAFAKNFQGESVLKLECRSKEPNFDVIRELVSANPSLVEKELPCLLQSLSWDFIRSNSYDYEELVSNPKFQRRWEIIQYLLQRSQMRLDSNSSEINYAHVVLNSRTRVSFWLLGVLHKMYPSNFTHTTHDSGRTILSLAIQYKNEYMPVEDLFSMSPNCIDHIDPQTSLYPFMQAAIGESSSLDDIYFLLQQNPNLVLPSL